MPKRISVELTASQVQELEDVRHHHAKPYMRERAAAVLKVAAGTLLTEVAENGLLIRHEPETVHLWIKLYLKAGLGGWTIQTGRGRKGAFFPKSQAEARAEVAKIIPVAPPERSRWSLASIRQAVNEFQERTLACVWKTLQRLGLVYKRGREYVHAPDRDYQLKIASIEAAKQQVLRAPEQVVRLYQDELTYYRRPTLARAYAASASKEPQALLGYSSNKKRRIAASLNWQTGQLHAQQLGRFGVAQLKRYYQQIELAYPQATTLYLVQDNWPVHRHPDLLTFFQSSRLVPLWLPTYAPWTNPVEKVWLRLKQEVLHLHAFGDDWQGLQTAVHTWLNRWTEPSADLLHFVGLSPY